LPKAIGTISKIKGKQKNIIKHIVQK